jgi:hypothetical protein
MINWRGLVLNVFGLANAVIVFASIAVLSVTTTLVALLPWRVLTWDKHGPLLGIAFLSLTSAALLVAYHSHSHSLGLLLVPAIAVSASLPTSDRFHERLHWLVDVVVLLPSGALVFWSLVLARLGVPDTLPGMIMTLALVFAVFCIAWSTHSTQEDNAVASPP